MKILLYKLSVWYLVVKSACVNADAQHGSAPLLLILLLCKVLNGPRFYARTRSKPENVSPNPNLIWGLMNSPEKLESQEGKISFLLPSNKFLDLRNQIYPKRGKIHPKACTVIYKLNNANSSILARLVITLSNPILVGIWKR